MALKLHVEKPGMETTARNMEKGIRNFRDAVQQVQKTADALNGMWKGEHHDAFVQQQAEYTAYSEELAKLVDETIATLRDAVKEYTATDEECARLLRAL